MKKSDIAAIEAWAKLADAYRQDVKDLQEQLNLLEIENANLNLLIIPDAGSNDTQY